MKIPFYMHDLGQAEVSAVAQALTSPILTTGDTVAQFEQEFASFLHRKHALGVTSCTGAMHMALLALGIGPGDEVITTPLTFIATSTAIIEAGATPVFVDIEADTGNIDAGKIEAAITPRTRAILPVHLFGQMCDMRAIHDIAKRHKLAVIEDSAHCVEGIRDGVRPGELSDAACFSFYATKNLTCGEGGAVVTDSEELAASLRLLRLHGMTKTAADRFREGYTHWDMVSLGWKYNMDNIQAALLLPQMQRIDAKIVLRDLLAKYYGRKLEKIAGLKTVSVLDHVLHARHVYPVLVHPKIRDSLIVELNKVGITTVVNYRAIHLLTYFRDRLGYSEKSFPIAEQFGDSVLSLPFFPGMAEEQVDYVSENLAIIINQLMTSVNSDD